MKLSTMLDTVAKAIANNAGIEAYCQANFKRSISVYVHIDPKNPPSISKAPWVGLTVQAYRRPIANNANTLEFDLESAVFCSNANATESKEGNVTTLDGFEKLEDFSDLVFSVIESQVSTSPEQLNLTYNDEQQTSLMISDFPGWISSRVWTVSKPI
jgi:hypothetical protein